MEAQEKLLNAGVIAEAVPFDEFTNVKGRLIPVDPDAGEDTEPLMEDTTRIKFTDQLAQAHMDIRQSEIILRALRRMQARLLVLCFERWNDRVEYLQHLREVARKVIMRMINMQLASVFHRWEWEWAVSKRARNLFVKVKAHGIHTMLLEWDAVVQEVLGDRREEKARLEAAYTAAETALTIAQGLRDQKVLHEEEQKTYACLLTLKWSDEDLLLTVANPSKGHAFVGFSADAVENVDWDAFTARAAEKHKLRPAVFPRLAKELEEQATVFLRDILPQRTEEQVDVRGVLRQVYRCARNLREASVSASEDKHILAMLKERESHVAEMLERCQRLSRSSVEVWRHAQWQAENQINKAEDSLLEVRPPAALRHLEEARKLLQLGGAMSKRANIISTRVRALAALKIFRARVRLGEQVGRERLSSGKRLRALEVQDVRFKKEITFERLLEAMAKHAESIQEEMEASAHAALEDARRALEGDGDAAGGAYADARELLARCQSICEKIEMPELDIEVRKKIAEDTNEAQQAEARGEALLQKADAFLKEGKFIETRDYLGAARAELQAAFALHRHLAKSEELEQELLRLEGNLHEQGLALLRGAIALLTGDGDINGAREKVAEATRTFGPLGGFDLAAAAAAGEVIQLVYFSVAGVQMRENIIGPDEKARMTPQERAVWNARDREGQQQRAEKLEAGVGGVGEGGGGREGASEMADVQEQKRERLVGDVDIILPDFSDMSKLSSRAVDALLRYSKRALYHDNRALYHHKRASYHHKGPLYHHNRALQ